MKKATIWALVVLMLMALLAGCTQQPAQNTPAPADDATEAPADDATEAPDEGGEEATPAPDEGGEGTEGEEPQPSANIDISETQELELSCWDIDNAWGEDVAIDKFGEFILKKFNITIKTRNITWGDYGEKNQLWAASNDLPAMTTSDVVGGATFYQWINEGVVRALPDDSVMEQFPTLWYNMNTDQVKAFRVDGVAYHLPRMTYPNPDWYCMDNGIYYRKDWLEALNLEWPTNEQEFIDMCVAFQTQDPDGNGKNDTIGLGTISSFWPLWQGGTFSNYGINQGSLLVDENGVVTDSLADENTLKLMSMLRRLNKAGGLDPDFMTHASDDECIDKFCAGLTGVFLKQVSPTHMNTVFTKWQNLQPDKDFFECVGLVTTDMLWEVEGVERDEWGRIPSSSHWSEYYFGSKVTDEEILRYLLVFDWMSSDEGMKFMGYGFEGEDWEYDADGNMVNLLPDNESGTPGVISDKYPNAGCPSLCVWTGDMTQYINPNIDQRIRDWCVEERELRISTIPNPPIDYRLNAISTDEKLENTSNPGEDWALFITDTSDKTDEELYAEMVAKWDTLGHQAMLDSLTAAYQELYIN